MPDRSGFRLAALIAAMACPGPVAAQSLEDVVPFDPASMAETGRFCEANWADVYDDPTLKRMCHNVFICGDGGCLPEYIVAVVAREMGRETLHGRVRDNGDGTYQADMQVLMWLLLD